MPLKQPSRRSRAKTLSAGVGVTTLVAMGIVTAALTHQSHDVIISEPFTYTSPAPPDMSTGEKTVSPTLESTVTAPLAEPGITTTPTSAELD